MGTKKQRKIKDNLKDMDNQMLERLHRKLFHHPDSNKRDEAGSLSPRSSSRLTAAAVLTPHR